MEIKTLNDLYLAELCRAYGAAKDIQKAMPKINKAVSNPEMTQELLDCMERIDGEIGDLDLIFIELDHSREEATCPTTAQLLGEVLRLINMDMNAAVRDAAILSSMHRIFHVARASYGVLRGFAGALERDDDYGRLDTILDNKHDDVTALEDLAEYEVGDKAATADKEQEQEGDKD